MHFYLLSQRMQIVTSVPEVELNVDTTNINPERAWEIWQIYRELKLDSRRTPDHLVQRERATKLNRYLLVALGVGALGIILAMSAFLLRSTKSARG